MEPPLPLSAQQRFIVRHPEHSRMREQEGFSASVGQRWLLPINSPIGREDPVTIPEPELFVRPSDHLPLLGLGERRPAISRRSLKQLFPRSVGRTRTSVRAIHAFSVVRSGVTPEHSRRRWQRPPTSSRMCGVDADPRETVSGNGLRQHPGDRASPPRFQNPDYWTHRSCGKCDACLRPNPTFAGYCDNCGCAHCQLDRAG